MGIIGIHDDPIGLHVTFICPYTDRLLLFREDLLHLAVEMEGDPLFNA